MNKELIDRNELLSIYKKWIPQLTLPEDEGDKRGVETCIAVLEDAPTIDAVEVIRCSDCEYWNRNNISCEGLAKCVTGESGIRYRTKNDFCSKATKRN